LQPDTLIPDLSASQGWNRYSYVQNDPVRFNDPTGHMVACGVYEDDCHSGTGGGGSGSGTSTGSGGTGGNGGGGGSGGGSGDSYNVVYELSNELDNLVIPIIDPLYDILGSSGCNSLLLWDGEHFCHHTTYTHQPICVPVSLCSSLNDEMYYAVRFQYPGQWPGNPVVDGDKRYVMDGDFFPSWQWLRDKGAITVEIDGTTMINRTRPSHIFHQGDITRTISNGWVTTEGHGSNSSFAVAAFNQYGGPVAFQTWDFLVTTFSTLDKLSQGPLINLAFP